MSATKRWIEDLQMAGQDPLSNDKHLDDDYQYQEYLNTLAESMGYGKPKPVTMEETQAQHDAWWNSLTEEQKQQLYNDQEELFKLTIEEMNHERE